MRILVVDDDPLIRDLVRDMVDPDRYSVLTASCGHEALEACQAKQRPDLVLLDIDLGTQPDGIAVFQALQEAPSATPKVVFLTGAKPEAVEATAGCAGFLRKPFSPLELLELLADLRDRDSL